MRIGLLTSVPETLDAFFPDWVDAWRQAGWAVSPASGPGPGGRAARIPGAAVIPGITRSPRPASGAAHRHLRDWVTRERLDVVLTSTATASALVRTARVGAPVAYFCHGLHWAGGVSLRTTVPRTLERSLLRATSGVVSLNSEDDAWFSAHLRDGQPHVRLRAGVGLHLESWPAVPIPDDRTTLRLVWVSEMSARKRPQDAVAVVRGLRVAGLDVEISMLGDGPLIDQVRHLAGATPGVHVVGRADPRPFLSTAHALLHTGAWEGLPRVALEAAATGRAVLGYDVKGVRDAPGSVVAGRAGDVAALRESVARWWRSGRLEPRVDRGSLDWRLAHAEVTELLAAVVGRTPGS